MRRRALGKAHAALALALQLALATVMAGHVRGARPGWAGRVALRPEDRVGFLRFKKVGSTTVSTYLHEVTGLCIDPCSSTHDECIDSSCLYQTRCKCPNATRQEFLQRQMRRFCYPCYHLTIRKLQQQFASHARKHLASVRQPTMAMSVASTVTPGSRHRRDGPPPRLYLLTLVRDPFDRLLSEFFYVRTACDRKDKAMLKWLRLYTPTLRRAICFADFETFATHPESHAVNGQVRQIMDMEYNTSHDLAPSHLEMSLRVLAESSLVLVTDRLLPAGLALVDFTFSQNGRGLMPSRALLDAVPRRGPSMQRVTAADAIRANLSSDIALRANLSADTQLRQRVLSANAMDFALYNAALQHFKAAYAAMRQLDSG